MGPMNKRQPPTTRDRNILKPSRCLCLPNYSQYPSTSKIKQPHAQVPGATCAGQYLPRWSVRACLARPRRPHCPPARYPCTVPDRLTPLTGCSRPLISFPFFLSFSPSPSVSLSSAFLVPTAPGSESHLTRLWPLLPTPPFIYSFSAPAPPPLAPSARTLVAGLQGGALHSPCCWKRALLLVAWDW